MLHAQLLRAFRSVMPGAAGVVLVDEGLRPLAQDAPGADAATLVAEARPSLLAGASALVPFAGALYLVVQVPRALLEAPVLPA